MSEDKEKRIRTITVKGSPVVFSKLVNGEDYIFTVRTCNQVTSSTSTPSKKVTPLKLPPKPRITNIRGKPNELLIDFSCPNAKAKDVQASFEVIVAPPLDEESQVYKLKEGRLMVPDDDSEPIRLCGLVNGQTYKIIIASVNAVGVSYSEPESAYPSLAPPQPQLVSVEAGNREITTNDKLLMFDSYDDPQIKAWFEVELLPEQPEVPSLKTQIDAEAWEEMEKLGAETDKVKKLAKKQHKSTKSKVKNKTKTKGKPSSGKTKKQGEEGTPTPLGSSGEGEEKHEESAPMSPSLSATPGVEEVAPHMRRLAPRSRLRKKSTWAKELGEDSVTNEKPLFRRAKRYASSPIRISPLNNGEEYAIRIKAVTLTETKITDFSKGVVPKGVPPMPKIVKLIPRQNSAMIAFECNDYATEEYRAKYEIESIPPTITMKDCTSSPILFKGLRNGVNYKFTVCGKNKEGRSQWSDQSEGVTPLMVCNALFIYFIYFIYIQIFLL
ncbi:fibronectin type III domain-containing protein [Reticulomyxa filosa]|uniref:Fibronectin type III domain-containing protein n=1 Tax=Reticulomyxa filosa TaxID=46433 RepID=X6MM64_RETFI|nr:fibronectin type III domain-containing protein [Reticulomyxa filosa]|eukprot:ETO14527.1 fibronectin type III domain-containing protein [Reticulomyxa filosa]